MTAHHERACTMAIAAYEDALRSGRLDREPALVAGEMVGICVVAEVATTEERDSLRSELDRQSQRVAELEAERDELIRQREAKRYHIIAEPIPDDFPFAEPEPDRPTTILDVKMCVMNIDGAVECIEAIEAERDEALRELAERPKISREDAVLVALHAWSMWLAIPDDVRERVYVALYEHGDLATLEEHARGVR